MSKIYKIVSVVNDLHTGLTTRYTQHRYTDSAKALARWDIILDEMEKATNTITHAKSPDVCRGVMACFGYLRTDGCPVTVCLTVQDTDDDDTTPVPHRTTLIILNYTNEGHRIGKIHFSVETNKQYIEAERDDALDEFVDMIATRNGFDLSNCEWMIVNNEIDELEITD